MRPANARIQTVALNNIYESASVGYDPRLEGFGSSPTGGRNSNLIVLPSEPTTEPRNRYLVHLTSVVVPAGQVAALCGFRQAIQIGVATQAPGAEQLGATITQTNPFWHFPDANITWYLRWIGGRPGSSAKNAPKLPRGYSRNLYVSDSAILAQSVGPYVALNGGLPPGEPFDDDSDIYSLVNPFNTTAPLSQRATRKVGPGIIAIYASVWQTNPSRQRGTQGTAPTYFLTEDQFVAANPAAIYTGVAASLIVAMGPLKP